MVEKPRQVSAGPDRWARVAAGGYTPAPSATTAACGAGARTLSASWATPRRPAPDAHPRRRGQRLGPGERVVGSLLRRHRDRPALVLGPERRRPARARRQAQRWRPQAVAPSQIWTSVTTGDAVTCALDGAGRPWCWGAASYGQLGAGNGASTVPLRSEDSTSLTMLDAGWMHVCGLSGANQVCWGSNEAGQLNTTTASARQSAPSDQGDPGEAGAHPPAGRAPARRARTRSADAATLGRAQLRREIGDRPAVPVALVRPPASRSRRPVMTFNMLGSQHTAPSGTGPTGRPGGSGPSGLPTSSTRATPRSWVSRRSSQIRSTRSEPRPTTGTRSGRATPWATPVRRSR